MKTLSFEQMESITAGSKKIISCLSQVASGLGVLWSAAAMIAFGTTPIGGIIFLFGVASLIFSGINDPTACDF